MKFLEVRNAEQPDCYEYINMNYVKQIEVIDEFNYRIVHEIVTCGTSSITFVNAMYLRIVDIDYVIEDLERKKRG